MEVLGQGDSKNKKSHRKFSDQSIQVDDSATSSKEAQAFEALSGCRSIITGFSVKNEGSFSTFKLYDVITEKEGCKMVVQRRFKDFEWLQETLVLQFYGLVLPRLPQKNIMTTFDLEGEAYQNERMRLLERFLNSLLRKQKVCRSPALMSFLSMTNSDFAIYLADQAQTEAGEILRVSTYEEVRQTFWSLVADP